VRSRGVESKPPPQKVEVARDPELELFGRSLERSRGRRGQWIFARRRRRRRRRERILVAVLGGVAVATILVAPGVIERGANPAVAKQEATPPAEGRAAEPPARRHAHAALPESGALERAWSFAGDRAGLVSIAVIDSRGHLHGFDADRTYASASVSKALLLAAELQRLEAAGAPLDASTRALLARMITLSDNDAADSIYYRVGDAALYDVARAAGMESFSVAGYWAESQITAADMARFMWNLEDAFAGPHRAFALGLLGSIVSSQRWGIPAGAGEGWNDRFKGGWRPSDSGSLVHQAAELSRDGERLALAVLSDGQPSHEYGTETLRGIADRLVGPMSSEPWDGRWR
jgi:Beta-lactamase enzyme family